MLRSVKLDSVVDIRGHFLLVDKHDFLGLTTNRSYEPKLTSFLEADVRPGQTTVDLIG